MRPNPTTVKVHPLLALAQQHAHRPQAADDFAAEGSAYNQSAERSFEPGVATNISASFPHGQPASLHPALAAAANTLSTEVILPKGAMLDCSHGPMCAVVYGRDTSPRRPTSHSPHQPAITITITEPDEAQHEIEAASDPVSPYPDPSLLVVPEPEEFEEPDLDLDEPTVERPVQVVGYARTPPARSNKSLVNLFQLYAAGIKWSRAVVADRGKQHGTFEHMLATLVLSILLVTIPVVAVLVPAKWVFTKLRIVKHEWVTHHTAE